jgi:hypothetical protein
MWWIAVGAIAFALLAWWIWRNREDEENPPCHDDTALRLRDWRPPKDG